MLPRVILTAALVLPAGASATAQTRAPEDARTPAQFDAPAYVAIVDGGATLERDGRIEASPRNMPLLTGDRLRTLDGRVEVRFSDGGRLRLDARTAIDVLSDELVRLVDGRLRLSLARAAQRVSYRIDSPAGSVRLFQPGEYRISLLHGNAEETQLEFAVVSGGGEIVTEQGSTPVRAGERAYASAGLMPSYAYSFNSAIGDAFDRWVDQQRGAAYDSTSRSAQYLPPDMTSYSTTFDRYGDWRYQPSYGYVWYPRVATDWRPYYYGRWTPYPRYGWTWIAADPFGYPTHHYGRWGLSSGVWFWIPSRAWAPAYVSWAYAPDYVSWCPLGWDDRAVFSITYYNVGPSYYASHYAGDYSSAWTTVRHEYFGRGYADQHVVAWDRDRRSARPQFTEGRAPLEAERAVPRGSTDAPGDAPAPLRFAGRRIDSNGGPVQAGRAAPERIGRETPRDVHPGDGRVRTAQPMPPRTEIRTQGDAAVDGREHAVTRTAPPQGASGPGLERPSRAWDHPAYRPYDPASAAPPERARAYEPPPQRQDTPPPPHADERAHPRQDAPPPPPRLPGRVEPAPRPSGGEHAVPRQTPAAPGSDGHVDSPAPRSSGVARPRQGG